MEAAAPNSVLCGKVLVGGEGPSRGLLHDYENWLWWIVCSTIIYVYPVTVPNCPTPGRVFLTIALVVPSATFVITESGLARNVGCQQSSSNKHLASCPRPLEMLCCNSLPQSIVGVMIQACMVGVIFRSVHGRQNQTLQQWTFTFFVQSHFESHQTVHFAGDGRFLGL